MSETEFKDLRKELNPFECVHEGIIGVFNSLADWKAAGCTVNSRDPKTNGTMLHIAAALGSRSLLREIIKDPDVDYLVQDFKGRYPSELAYRVARDCALGRLLLKKEMQQASEADLVIYGPDAGKKRSECVLKP